MEKEISEILSAVIKAAIAAAAGICNPNPDEDRFVNDIQRLKEKLILADQDQFYVFHQVGNCLRQLEKHPRKKIRCLAIDVSGMCMSKLGNKTIREHKTVELHGPESSSVNPGDVIVKPEESLKSEPYETDTSVNNKSKKSSFMKAGNFLTACSKLERHDRPNDVKGENSKTRESIENASEPLDDENSPEEKKHGDNDKNPIPGGGVVPKLISVPLTNDKVRDQVREILAEAMCKVSTEVSGNIQEQVSACDPYRIAALLETITFEKWGKFDGPHEYKYRCIMLNLKDPSNPEFRRKILLGQLPAHSIVKLTREEMASEERQRQIQIIKEKAVLNLPRYCDWSSCLCSCACKEPESERRVIRYLRRGLNVGHHGWKRIGHRKKKRIARGSGK